MIKPLNKRSLARAARELAERDPGLARLLRDDGAPPLWDRPQGFPTLVQIILEQQVSLISAAAMYRRLRERIAPFTPARFLELGERFLRELGVTRQKASYCIHLARAIDEGSLDLEALNGMEDREVADALVTLKGIGPWTAMIYLLMAMGRPDIWPTGDIALAAGIKRLKRLKELPSRERQLAYAVKWRPWRSVAARMLWQRYLKEKPEKKAPPAN
jgi:DNA-3-methyladenine glycosylase II